MDEIILESFPFDSMEVLNTESEQMEPDREYEASIFRKYFKMFLSNGVYYGHYKNYGENSMKVTANGGMNVKVATGAGLIEGADFENIEERIITLERPVTNTRIDRIVVQFNASLDTRATKLIVKQGNENSPAELQRDENIYEICIAEVTTKSTSNITAEDIVDKRTDKDVCGIVNSLISVDGEELYQQFEEHIETITDNIMLKNQDNICTGKITAQNGFEGNLKGDVDGNAKTASKLKNIGVISGSISVTASSTMGQFNGSGSTTINYPEGFNKDNCVIISVETCLPAQGIYSCGNIGGFKPVDAQRGMFPCYSTLNSSNILVQAYNATTNEININFKVVLMKI